MEKRPKLALSMIVKDDNEGLVRVLKTVHKFVDGIFITHTSKENEDIIKHICKGYDAEYSYFEWVDDFSAARNFAMEQIPKDFTHMMWLDDDDVVLGGALIPQELERMVEEDLDALQAEYLYLMSEEGYDHFYSTGRIRKDQILLRHRRERIIKLDPERDRWKWIAPLHETLVYQAPNPKIARTEQFSVLHLTSKEKLKAATERNLKILERKREQELSEDKIDPRTTFYLARVYFDTKEPEYLDEAEKLLKEYLNASGWDEERCLAWNYLGDIYRMRNQLAKAMQCSFKALEEDPKFKESYAGIASTYLLAERWDRAKFWALKGLNMPDPDTTTIQKPRSTDGLLLHALGEACLHLNEIDESWSAFKKLNKLVPNKEELQAKLGFLEKMREERKITRSWLDLMQKLEQEGDKKKIQALVTAFPEEFSDNALFNEFRKRHAKPKKWHKKELAVYCGPGFETWSPDSVERGVGGSEEAVIYLTKELAKRGWEVTVYGDPPVEKEYDGVNYVHFPRFNPQDKFNVLWLWRRPASLDREYDANLVLLDLHDVPNPSDFTEERLENVDKILVKSEYHRSFLPDVPDEKFEIISNGILVGPLERIKTKKKKKRLFWGSSYDRGLEGLLTIWPYVKDEVEDAELHVCYGWELFDSVYRNNPERMAWKEKMEKLLRQDGIIHHGRVGHDELATIMAKCSIFAYPTTFEEINCITAIRAQALGLVPVVTNYAALKETVQHGVKVDANPAGSDSLKSEVLEEYKKKLISLLKDEENQEEIREKMVNWARETYSWEKIADQWLEVIEKNASK